MLEDAKNQSLDCVIVKDFSRFGRDYVEVGSYLEQIFPFLGIRFISINDHYDSASYQRSIMELDTNFKNLLYDLYSKDLSQKVKSSLKAKKESGKYVSAHAPFGYEKSPHDRHMLFVCEEEAKVVREIFSLALQGMTVSQITRKFNMENVPTPLEFKMKKGSISRKPKGDKFFWSGSVISRILHNPVYVGDIVYGKTEKEQVGGQNILKPREEWKMIANHHAPVIVREDFERVQKTEDFERVQKTAGGETGKKRRGKQHLLAGRVVCGFCKHRLQIKGRREFYFTCPNWYMAEYSSCVHKMRTVDLEQMVLFQVEKYVKEQGITREVVRRHKDELLEKHASLLREIRQAEREYGRIRRKHYEDYGLYAAGEQAEFHSGYEEMKEKQKRIEELQEKMHQVDDGIDKMESGEDILGEEGLTEEVMERYIEEVRVYREGKIEIRWKQAVVDCGSEAMPR